MGKQALGKKLLHSKFFGLLLFTVVLALLIFLIEDKFASKGNIRQILIGMCVPGIMLASVGPLLIAGQIDLAAGAEAALGSLIFAQVLKYFPSLPWGIGMIIALAAGVVFGLVNVFLVNKMKFMAFIATIGVSSVYSGLANMWTRTNDVTISRQDFTGLGKAAIGEWVPVLFVFMIVVVAIYGYILSNTRFGRSVYMVGGNPYAARLSGLKPDKIRAALFINSSVMAVLAGIVWSAQKKMASSTNITTSAPNMAALTATILGGISFMGGSGGMAGAFAALLLLNVFNSGLLMVGLPTFVTTMMGGLILIAALIMDNVNASRQRRALQRAAILGDKAKTAA